jgi:hypothetical protein
MKILLICKGEYRYWFPKVAASLKQQYGCTVSAMTFSTRTARILERTRKFDGVHNLAAHLKHWFPRSDTQQCVQRLQELDLYGELGGSLNTMVYSDRIISRYSLETVTKIIAGVYDFWDSRFKEGQFDAVVGEIASASEWIAWVLANKLDIPYLVPYPAPLTNRFFFLQSPTGAWERAEELYERAKATGLSRKEAQLAEDFLCAFRANKPKPSLHPLSSRSPFHLDVRLLVQRIARIPFRVRTYLEDGYFEVGSYDGTHPWDSVWTDLLRLLRHAASELAIFETQVSKSKKVYFPLHVQPEFTIDVRAPFCSNQLALIDNIAKSVPMGYRLVVKEHPAMRGYRNLTYYREIKKLYNVQLLSPLVDSHNLIRDSDAILTIVGTTAWEGILYEKPVVAFGPLCYGFFDLLYHCKNIADLPLILSEAIRAFKPDRDLLLKFVWAMLGSAHEGLWDSPLRSPSVTDEHNISKLATAIVSELSLAMRAHSTDPMTMTS